MQLPTMAVIVEVLLSRAGWSGQYPDCMDTGLMGAGEGQKPVH